MKSCAVNSSPVIFDPLASYPCSSALVAFPQELFYFLLLPPIIFEAGYTLRKKVHIGQYCTLSSPTVNCTVTPLECLYHRCFTREPITYICDQLDVDFTYDDFGICDTFYTPDWTGNPGDDSGSQYHFVLVLVKIRPTPKYVITERVFQARSYRFSDLISQYLSI